MPDETYYALIGGIMDRARELAAHAAATGVTEVSQEAEFENDLKIALGEIGGVWPASAKEDGDHED